VSRRATAVASTALTGLVVAYQWTVRPLIGPNCRFHPGCSDYAVQAIRQHGPLRGTALAARRVLRCHPWNQGGYDPVPAPSRRSADARIKAP
jgi:putative membrane protein insertion efficiency factor